MLESSTHSTGFPQFVIIILHQVLQKGLDSAEVLMETDMFSPSAFEQPEQPAEQTLTQLLQP